MSYRLFISQKSSEYTGEGEIVSTFHTLCRHSERWYITWNEETIDYDYETMKRLTVYFELYFAHSLVTLPGKRVLG